jgi:hypothetical protein
MTVRRARSGLIFLLCSLASFSASSLGQDAVTPASAARDWLTWGGDQQRSGWARAETTLSKENVSRLDLKWRTQLDTAPSVVVLSTLTAPLVVENVRTPQGPEDLVFVVGSNDTVYALEADTGKVAWQRRFPNTLAPKSAATYLCPNTQNSTPVIDKASGILYVLNSDGKLRGLNVADGEERFPPTPFSAPFTRPWSLNLIDGILYANIGRGCGGVISHMAAMDLKDPAHSVMRFYTSTGRPAGAWGRGGPVLGPKGIYVQTADGPYDPAMGRFGNSVLVFGLKTMQLLDSFTPSNLAFLNTKDLDLGSAGPVLFPFDKWQLAAVSSKESVIYLLDANSLGGADHRTPLYQSPRYGNDELQLWGRGVWGAMATSQDAAGKRWLYVPMWGPPSKQGPPFQYRNGPVEKGSVMAFQLGIENDKPALIPVWTSRDMHVPDPPLFANGVVFVVATGENTRQGGYFPPEVRAKPVGHVIFYALDAETGKELYSSGDMIDTWTHFGGLALAKGRVYFTTWDAKVYSFGLKQ